MDRIIITRTNQITDVCFNEDWSLLDSYRITDEGVREIIRIGDKIIERERYGDKVINLQAIRIHPEAIPMVAHDKLILFIDQSLEIEDKDVWRRCLA
jgi:hypothetical protein